MSAWLSLRARAQRRLVRRQRRYLAGGFRLEDARLVVQADLLLRNLPDPAQRRGADNESDPLPPGPLDAVRHPGVVPGSRPAQPAAAGG